MMAAKSSAGLRPADAHLGLFVTGTDTAVGKTVASCVLLRALAATGRRVIGMKPVAAGLREVNGQWISDDVLALKRASNVTIADRLVNPYAFAPPIAPHIAAALAGVSVDLDHIERCHAELSAIADVTIVEGAGGVLVPLNEQHDMLDIARRLQLAVILVVGVRLGCLNHALLSLLAIQSRGAPLKGWIANELDPNLERANDAIAWLEARTSAPCVARFAWRQAMDDDVVNAMARRLALAPLLNDPS